MNIVTNNNNNNNNNDGTTKAPCITIFLPPQQNGGKGSTKHWHFFSIGRWITIELSGRYIYTLRGRNIESLTLASQLLMALAWSRRQHLYWTEMNVTCFFVLIYSTTNSVFWFQIMLVYLRGQHLHWTEKKTLFNCFLVLYCSAMVTNSTIWFLMPTVRKHYNSETDYTC